MSKMTLLQMVQAACNEMGVNAPPTLQSAFDQNAIQLLALANREGKECSKAASSAGGWQELRQEYTFNVQSTGLINFCSYTAGSNVINVGLTPWYSPWSSQWSLGNGIPPQVGWVICTSGGSNSTGFPANTVVTAVNGSIITVSNNATSTNSLVSMAFGKQSYALPPDYDYMISGTQWDRGFRWQIFGPLTPQEWQVLKSGLSPTGPRRRFRLMGNMFYLDPVPYDSNMLVYEYYSTNWCLTGGNATTSPSIPASSFLQDTDTYILEDDLMVLGIIWRWRRAKGLDYTQEYDTYSKALQRELGRDTTSRTLRLDVSQPDVALMTSNQIPDTGFGT